ncbi:hypothetical protein AN958_06283 [Leucoagaricus sp. SymC.cos]|nr:hypothetical protein AN958_06283 [Leucoagaricus sp. SymC.cos]
MTEQQTENNRLRIFQLNMNKSETAHLDLINRKLGEYWDIVCIQEPHITKLGHIRTPNRYRQVFSSARNDPTAGKVRSVIWVNERLDTNNWEVVNIPDTNDITAIRIRSGFNTLVIFNIYNPCDSNNTQNNLDDFFTRKRAEFYGSEDKHVIWCGDFN